MIVHYFLYKAHIFHVKFVLWLSCHFCCYFEWNFYFNQGSLAPPISSSLLLINPGLLLESREKKRRSVPLTEVWGSRSQIVVPRGSLQHGNLPICFRSLSMAHSYQLRGPGGTPHWWAGKHPDPKAGERPSRVAGWAGRRDCLPGLNRGRWLDSPREQKCRRHPSFTHLSPPERPW